MDGTTLILSEIFRKLLFTAITGLPERFY